MKLESEYERCVGQLGNGIGLKIPSGRVRQMRRSGKVGFLWVCCLAGSPSAPNDGCEFPVAPSA